MNTNSTPESTDLCHSRKAHHGLPPAHSLGSDRGRSSWRLRCWLQSHCDDVTGSAVLTAGCLGGETQTEGAPGWKPQRAGPLSVYKPAWKVMTPLNQQQLSLSPSHKDPCLDSEGCPQYFPNTFCRFQFYSFWLEPLTESNAKQILREDFGGFRVNPLR